MEGLDLERLVLSAGPLGIMKAALDVTLPYTHQREQFGTPIATQQLVQGKLADMYTKYRASSAFTYGVAREIDEAAGKGVSAALDGQNKDAADVSAQSTSTLVKTQDCAGAILYAAERATECALDCIQLLGGTGYVNEIPAGRLLRDAKLYEIGAGTSEVRRMVIGRAFNKEFGVGR